jgi:hypothetical protein
MKKVSERGVYYDLSLSPYEFKHPYTNTIFKFSSAKRLDMFVKRISSERVRFQKIIGKLDFLQIEEKKFINNRMEAWIYEFVYQLIEGDLHG